MAKTRIYNLSDYEAETFPFGDGGLGEYVAIADPANPTRVIKPNVDGSVNVIASSNTGSVPGTELIRPNDVLPYLAGDTIADNATPGLATIGQFLNMSRLPSSAGYMTGMQMFTSLKTCIAELWVHLWSAPPTTVIADNVPFFIDYADKATYLGYIVLPALSTQDNATSTCAVAFDDAIRKRIVTDVNMKVYWQLQTKTAFTPVALQKFFPVPTVEKN